jgi:hypothetical protein
MYQTREKEEPWSLPGLLNDFSITYTKTQRLREIGRPKTCKAGRVSYFFSAGRKSSAAEFMQ